jgi:hypothetical protein
MATVDDLLRRLHRQAAGLHPTGQPARQLQAHLRGWGPLASHASRVLEALDPRPEDRDLYGLLHELARTARPGRPDAALASLALTMGALSDVIGGAPDDVGQTGQAQRSRLQASIQAALHAAARVTHDLARAAGREHDGDTVHKIAEATELAALLPPLARVSTLERLTVTRLTPDTVDGAVQLWAAEAERTFTHHRIVTGVALQDAAATLALLCQATATTLHEAGRRHVLDPATARDTARLLNQACTAWRTAAAWPSNVLLPGNAHEHRHAAQAVRHAINGPPLARLTLRERVTTLRVAIATAAQVGDLQARTVVALANRGGLWVARERDNLRPPGVERRHVRLEWDTLYRGHPAHRLIIDTTTDARQALAVAAQAVNQAILPDSPLRGDAGRITLVDHRIVADWWEIVEADPKGRSPEETPGLGSSRAIARRIGP